MHGSTLDFHSEISALSEEREIEPLTRATATLFARSSGVVFNGFCYDKALSLWLCLSAEASIRLLSPSSLCSSL